MQNQKATKMNERGLLPRPRHISNQKTRLAVKEDSLGFTYGKISESTRCLIYDYPIIRSKEPGRRKSYPSN